MSHVVRLESTIHERRPDARATMPGVTFLLSWVAILAACAAVWYVVLTLTF